MSTKYKYHWLFAAVLFFAIAVGLSWNLARAYVLGYWSDILSTQFDTMIYFGAAGVAIVLTVICLNRSSPLDLLNYIARLERENRALRRAVKIFRDNPQGAMDRKLAHRIIDRMGEGENIIVKPIAIKRDA